jgi:hypothetical protein
MHRFAVLHQDQLAEALAKHAEKLKKAQQDLEDAALGKGKVNPDGRGEEEVPAKAFRPGGLALMGAEPPKTKKAAAGAKRSAAAAPVGSPSAKMPRTSKSSAASAPTGPSAASAPAGHAAAAVPGEAGTSRVTVQAGEDWKKVDPQAVLDGHVTVAKKLNGVAGSEHKRLRALPPIARMGETLGPTTCQVLVTFYSETGRDSGKCWFWRPGPKLADNIGVGFPGSHGCLRSYSGPAFGGPRRAHVT